MRVCVVVLYVYEKSIYIMRLLDPPGPPEAITSFRVHDDVHPIEAAADAGVWCV
jgi:hypothetical protein